MHKFLIPIILALLPAISTAGLFGPSNYEDCLLDGMKGVKTDQAARVVAFACRKKFPEPASRNQPVQTPEVAGLYTFLSISADRPSLNSLVTKLDWSNAATKSHGTDFGYGVKSDDFGYHLEVEIMNRNDFPVYGISIGIPAKQKIKSCSWSANDYSEVYDCNGSADAQRSGKFRCDVPRIKTRNPSFCVLGFSYYGTPSAVEDFMRSKGIPKISTP